MAARDVEGFGVWEVDGQSLTIRYSLSVMEEIRRAVVDGFLTLPRGGVEVGGVLFGVLEGNTVRITASRSLHCEHALGPAFILSKNDLAALEALLREPEKTPDLAALQPVGWYHSHTRSEISLTEQDLKIHDRYFPQLWQVALVLRPEKGQPTRAAFFARAVDGTLRGETGRGEWLLAPPPAVQVERETPPAVRQPPTPAPAVRLTHPEAPAMAAVQNGLPPEPEPEARHGASPWKWVALGLLALLIAAGFFGTFDWRHGSAPEPLLRAYDSGGQLLVSWDRNAPPVIAAQVATIDLVDGSRKLTFSLDGAQLRKGSLTYARQSGRVDLKMTLLRAGAVPVEETVSFIGQPGGAPARPAPQPQAAPQQAAAEAQLADITRQRDRALHERDQSNEEAAKLRADVNKLSARNRELEQAIRILRQRLFVESSRRK